MTCEHGWTGTVHQVCPRCQQEAPTDWVAVACVTVILLCNALFIAFLAWCCVLQYP